MSDAPASTFSLLLASSVHDIKNSLGMLIDTLDQVMRETPISNDSQRRQFATLQGEAARINNDLLYLLGLYRLEQGQLPLNIREVFVADFLQELAAQNELLFDIRQLRCDIDCELDARAYFDPGLIGGVINNVVVNAARYAKQSVRMRARVGNGLTIEIEDDGAGFPQTMLDNVGNPQRGIDFSSGSSSLGLYFAGCVARLHQRDTQCGHIALSNLAHGGGCFTLWLP
jgi:signal transduction histidine kinase